MILLAILDWIYDNKKFRKPSFDVVSIVLCSNF